jgi:hypothetical protein
VKRKALKNGATTSSTEKMYANGKTSGAFDLREKRERAACAKRERERERESSARTERKRAARTKREREQRAQREREQRAVEPRRNGDHNRDPNRAVERPIYP